jgi:hypothetical protein
VAILAAGLAATDGGITSCADGFSAVAVSRKDFRGLLSRESEAGDKLCSYDREDILAILEAGQYIKHFQYGCGVITESSSERTTIDFDAHGIKKFVTSLMVIEPADGVPPKRRRAKRVKAAAAPAPTRATRVFVPGAK